MVHTFDANTGSLASGIDVEEGEGRRFYIPLASQGGKQRKVAFSQEDPPQHVNGLTLQQGVLKEGKIVHPKRGGNNFATILFTGATQISGNIAEQVGDRDRLIRIDLGTTLTVRNHSKTFKLVYDYHGQLVVESPAVAA